MKIKEVATACDVSSKTIRYYEAMGLLNIEREANGYREFNEEQVARMKEICLFRSLDITIEDIKDYYESNDSLDSFLGFQLEKQQEKIYTLEENKNFMLQLQHKNKQELSKVYEERKAVKGYRSETQEIEKQYLSKTKRGKQKFMLIVVWGVALGIIFDLAMVLETFDSAATFGFISLGIIIVAYILSIMLWFKEKPRMYFIRLVCLIADLEELPEVLDHKMKSIIPWYWPRKIVTFLLAFIALFGPVVLVCWMLAILF